MNTMNKKCASYLLKSISLKLLWLRLFYLLLKCKYDNDVFTVTLAIAAREDRLAIRHALFCLQFPLVSLLTDQEKTPGHALKAVAKQH
jgi:hypothetical protein